MSSAKFKSNFWHWFHVSLCLHGTMSSSSSTSSSNHDYSSDGSSSLTLSSSTASPLSTCPSSSVYYDHEEVVPVVVELAADAPATPTLRAVQSDPSPATPAPAPLSTPSSTTALIPATTTPATTTTRRSWRLFWRRRRIHPTTPVTAVVVAPTTTPRSCSFAVAATPIISNRAVSSPMPKTQEWTSPVSSRLASRNDQEAPTTPPSSSRPESRNDQEAPRLESSQERSFQVENLPVPSLDASVTSDSIVASTPSASVTDSICPAPTTLVRWKDCTASNDLDETWASWATLTSWLPSSTRRTHQPPLPLAATLGRDIYWRGAAVEMQSRLDFQQQHDVLWQGVLSFARDRYQLVCHSNESCCLRAASDEAQAPVHWRHGASPTAVSCFHLPPAGVFSGHVVPAGAATPTSRLRFTLSFTPTTGRHDVFVLHAHGCDTVHAIAWEGRVTMMAWRGALAYSVTIWSVVEPPPTVPPVVPRSVALVSNDHDATFPSMILLGRLSAQADWQVLEGGWNLLDHARILPLGYQTYHGPRDFMGEPWTWSRVNANDMADADPAAVWSGFYTGSYQLSWTPASTCSPGVNLKQIEEGCHLTFSSKQGMLSIQGRGSDRFGIFTVTGTATQVHDDNAYQVVMVKDYSAVPVPADWCPDRFLHDSAPGTPNRHEPVCGDHCWAFHGRPRAWWYHPFLPPHDMDARVFGRGPPASWSREQCCLAQPPLSGASSDYVETPSSW
jgi:hypothetical protein